MSTCNEWAMGYYVTYVQVSVRIRKDTQKYLFGPFEKAVTMQPVFTTSAEKANGHYHISADKRLTTQTAR